MNYESGRPRKHLNGRPASSHPEFKDFNSIGNLVKFNKIIINNNNSNKVII